MAQILKKHALLVVAAVIGMVWLLWPKKASGDGGDKEKSKELPPPAEPVGNTKATPNFAWSELGRHTFWKGFGLSGAGWPIEPNAVPPAGDIFDAAGKLTTTGIVFSRVAGLAENVRAELGDVPLICWVIGKNADGEVLVFFSGTKEQPIDAAALQKAVKANLPKGASVGEFAVTFDGVSRTGKNVILPKSEFS
jgi:hypothetical protein